MSYDFMLLKHGRPVAEASDLDAAEVVPLGTPAEVAHAIARVYPSVEWDESERRGRLLLEDRWFEFSTGVEPSVMAVSVRTSFRQSSRDVIERLCDANGWLAFDGQAMEMYGAVPEVAEGGEPPGWLRIS